MREAYALSKSDLHDTPYQKWGLHYANLLSYGISGLKSCKLVHTDQARKPTSSHRIGKSWTHKCFWCRTSAALKYNLTEIIRGRVYSACTFTYSAFGQRTDPATFVRTCQIVLPAVIYSVLRSAPPKQQFVTMSSGTFMIPRSSPSGEIT